MTKFYLSLLACCFLFIACGDDKENEDTADAAVVEETDAADAGVPEDTGDTADDPADTGTTEEEQGMY